MVKAIIDIDEHANKVLNIVKAKHGLKDKSQAINRIAEDYAEHLLELALKPKIIDKLREVSKGSKE